MNKNVTKTKNKVVNKNMRAKIGADNKDLKQAVSLINKYGVNPGLISHVLSMTESLRQISLQDKNMVSCIVELTTCMLNGAMDAEKKLPSTKAVLDAMKK